MLQLVVVMYTAVLFSMVTAVYTKTETMLLLTPDQTTLAPPLVIEAAGQRCEQTTQFLLPRRHYPGKRWPLARNRPTDPPSASMPQAVRPGVV